jgi:chaperonin GroEL
MDKLKLHGDEATGLLILRKAVEEPLRWICYNAGKEGSVIVEAVKGKGVGIGYDANKDEYGNMIEKGIIDPLKVTRTGLENAASIANMILTTEALVADLPEKKEAMGAPPMPPEY